jgi:hypothetical protein
MNEVYAITDLHGYATQMREAAAKSLSDNYNDNLDDYITINQMVNLVTKECVGFDDQNRPLLDEDTNEIIFENTAIWIHNVGLAKLAAQDLVECAWDDKGNEMVFWKKEKNPNNESSKKPGRKNKKSKGQNS